MCVTIIQIPRIRGNGTRERESIEWEDRFLQLAYFILFTFDRQPNRYDFVKTAPKKRKTISLAVHIKGWCHRRFFEKSRNSLSQNRGTSALKICKVFVNSHSVRDPESIFAKK